MVQSRLNASGWLACLLLLSSSQQHATQSRVLVDGFVTPSIRHQRQQRLDTAITIAWQTIGKEEESTNKASQDKPFWSMFQIEEGKETKVCEVIRETVVNLAKLSLEDYKWRSSVFKANEADRRMEESVARMMGEDPSYVRPMDAGEEKIGPLGRAEKMAVSWLSKVIEEEGRRAERIADSDGRLLRPIDGVSPEEELGPLAFLEKQAVEFMNRIRSSERERVETGTLRPKDLAESKRGPLGDAEARAISALEEIKESEELRLEQSKLRGGAVVRPIDVPGPLGEIERKILDVFEAERERKKDRDRNEGKLVRPKDATVQGPLGEAEVQALNAVQQLQEEERERLKNIQRVMEENRPMELDRLSPLGILEAIVVGILRAPQLLFQVIQRVQELMSSETLEQNDEEILKKKEKQQQQQFRLRLPNLNDPDTSDPFS